MTSSFAPSPSVHVTGNVSGQVAAGTFVYQVQAPGGVVNQFVVKEPIKARARPCVLRPRRPPVPIGREPLISQALAALRTEPVQFYADDGWGKSTALKHLAYDDALATWRDGIVCLSGYGRPIEDLEQDLFDAFYESVLPDARVRATSAQLRTMLRDVVAVVLVDDVDVPPQHLERLIDDAPSCAFVVTSNDRSLSSATALAIGGLAEADAVSLFERGLGRTMSDADREAAARFAEVCRGQPRALMIAAATVRRNAISIDALAGQHSVGDLIVALRGGLDENEMRVLEMLAASHGNPLPASAVEEVVGSGTTEATLDQLNKDGLVLSASPRFRLPSPAIAGLGVADETLRQREADVLAGLTRWARQIDDPELLVAAGPAIVSVAEAMARRDPGHVVELARAAHAGLAVTGQWGMWTRLLTAGLAAASQSGDSVGTGWALHELGTHALLVGDRAGATRQLEESLRIREQIHDEPGVTVTRHNLKMLGGGGGARWGRVAAVGAVVAVIAAAVIYVLVSQSGDAGESTTSTTTTSVVRDSVAPATGTLDVSPTVVDFLVVPVGSPVAEQVVTVSNVGDASVDVSVALDGDAAFDLQQNCGTVEAGHSCNAAVRLSSSEPGTFTGTLHVEHGDDPEVDVAIRAVVAAAPDTTVISRAEISVAPSDMDFRTVEFSDGVVTRTVTISNGGSLPAQITTTLQDGSVFAVAQPCERVDAGSSCDAMVKFAATESGQFNDTLHIEGGDAGSIDVQVSAVVPATPDLSAEIVDYSGATTPEAANVRYWVVPITVVITNSGGAQVADPTRLTLETGDPTEPILLPVWVDGTPIDAFPVDAGLSAHSAEKVAVDVAFDTRLFKSGQDVNIRAFIDSCVGEKEFEVPPCRVAEESESNNVSSDFVVTIETSVD